MSPEATARSSIRRILSLPRRRLTARTQPSHPEATRAVDYRMRGKVPGVGEQRK
jgi:hypothetical protein